MPVTGCIEEAVSAIQSMDKSQLMDKLLHFKGKFEFDYTESYLADLKPEKLRHILLAATTTVAK
jgi:hypothetical protein